MTRAHDPRVERSLRRGREAALEELAARGLGGFQIESVAARSGLGKSTIYRLWGDRRALVLDALAHLSRQPPAPPAGPPRDRVRELLVHLTEAWGQTSRTGGVLPALVDAADRDPDLGQAVRGHSATRRAALVDAVDAAVESGDAPAGLDAEVAADALAGAVLYARLLGPRPLTAADVGPLVDAVLGPAPT